MNHFHRERRPTRTATLSDASAGKFLEAYDIARMSPRLVCGLLKSASRKGAKLAKAESEEIGRKKAQEAQKEMQTT